MSGLKMFECLGDCADFDLVNGCVATDQAEAIRASRQAQAQGQGRQEQQQQGGAEEEGEYSDGDGSEDGSQRSYSDVSATGIEEEEMHGGEGSVMLCRGFGDCFSPRSPSPKKHAKKRRTK